MINELVNRGFKYYLKMHEAKLHAHYRHPILLQQQQLAQLLRENADTAIGKKYAFSSLPGLSAFAESVPIHTYDDLWPYIQRIINNEPKVLTHQKVIWLSKTAGTTSGQSKFTPITRQTLRQTHFRASWYTLATIYAHQPDMRIFAQRNLLIGGGVYGKYPDKDIRVGDISGIIIRHIPYPLRPFYYPDVYTATLPSYEEKIRKTAHIAAQQKNITMLGGTPTWNLSLYRLILEKTGAQNLLELWPGLQVYVHGGVHFGPYRKQFEQLIPKPDFLYHEVYNASEGYFAIQDKRDRDDLLLLLNNGMYYEFICPEDYHKGRFEATIDLSQVEDGVPYALLLTTNSGLYRYLLGDVVTFTDRFPFRIKVTGRIQEYINAFGEDLQLEQAERALINTCRELKASVRDYTIAPKYIRIEERGCHQWLIEFVDPPADLSAFEQLLDKNLKYENSNYDQKRSNDFAIHQLEVISLPKGHFQHWLKDQGRLGGQAKVPKLVNNRKLVESLLQLLAKTHRQTQKTASQNQ